MSERISESTIRQSKINALKTKIRKEVEERTYCMQASMRMLLEQETMNAEEWSYCVNLAFFLTQLTEFINWEGAFQNKEAKYPNEDIIIYTISIDEIDIWLQENFSFVSHLLSVIEHDNGFANIAGYLEDRFLSRGLLNIVERTLYEHKSERQNSHL